MRDTEDKIQVLPLPPPFPYLFSLPPPLLSAKRYALITQELREPGSQGLKLTESHRRSQEFVEKKQLKQSLHKQSMAGEPLV